MADAAPRGRRARMLAAIAAAESELDRRNALPAGSLALRLARLRELLQRGRRARIAALGRRGSGKSSLLNALAGRALAVVGDVSDATRAVSGRELQLGGRVVEWFDTPGLRAGGLAERLAQVIEWVSIVAPDALVFTCQGTEVDAGIREDVADLARVARAVARTAGRAPALYAVVTKVDELAPPDVVAPPFDDAEKRANIQRAVTLLGTRLRRAGLEPCGVLPVCAYSGAGHDGAPVGLHWNLDAFARRVVRLLPADEVLGDATLVAELRGLLHAVMDGLTGAFAAMAESPGHAAGATGPTGEQLGVLQARLLGLLRGLAPHPMRAPRASGLVGVLARPGAVLEVLRAGATRVGVDAVSSAIAAARIRAAGAATRRLLLTGLDDHALRTLFDDA